MADLVSFGLVPLINEIIDGKKRFTNSICMSIQISRF